MRVYLLQFEGPGALQRAFRVLLESERVAHCAIESDRSRLRFLAPAKHALPLLERIYLLGGLTWCSRHDIVSHAADVLPWPGARGET